MKLEFYSVDELDHFLDWAYGMSVRVRAMRAEPVVPGVSGGVGGHSVFTAGDGSPADQEAKDLQCGPYDPAFVPPAPTGGAAIAPPAEPQKRKRRTKAEIEADDKAAADAEQAKAQEPIPDSPPKPSEGTNPFDTALPPDHAAPAGTLVSTRPDEAAGEVTVTPFQHLTRAREFIAKHGMPKYNESFAKAGLDANVMAYTAEQRALHLEALTALEGA